MSLNDYLKLFDGAGITERSRQETYSRYIDAAIAQGHAKIDELVGIGTAQYGLYVVSDRAVIQLDETGVFKKQVRVRHTADVSRIARLDVTSTAPSEASIKFEGRSWTKYCITGRDSQGQVTLEVTWNSQDERGDQEKDREHLLNLIKEAMAKARLFHVGLKPLTPRGEYLLAEIKDGYGSQFRGVSDDGASLFGPVYEKVLKVYQERLELMEPQWASHIEARLYD
jgi:hypothetical protein